ncbi:hypothetical protein XENORESO_001777 [Xenotaenia resolanae]|uniref:Uncharacterized protein n=1 Tax=Xenotaenia resolanae TaxID=208358 RepID=A0ABV0WUY6_9TELE
MLVSEHHLRKEVKSFWLLLFMFLFEGSTIILLELCKIFTVAVYIIFFFKLSLVDLNFIFSSADSSLLISDFEAQPTSAEAATEDDFDPIPVTGRKNSQVSGGHSRSNSGGSESSLPSLARSLMLVDQLIDL